MTTINGLLLASLLLVSYTRLQARAENDEPSIEQRVKDLQRQIDGNAPRVSEAELRKQDKQNLAEIRKMGLVDRAGRDFSSRLTNATILTWSIGYFVNTNTVWCAVRYRLPGRNEALQKEFGYTRKTGTNWTLMWSAERH